MKHQVPLASELLWLGLRVSHAPAHAYAPSKECSITMAGYGRWLTKAIICDAAADSAHAEQCPVRHGNTSFWYCSQQARDTPFAKVVDWVAVIADDGAREDDVAVDDGLQHFSQQGKQW